MRPCRPQGCLSPIFPAHPSKETAVLLIFCELPLRRIEHAVFHASNQAPLAEAPIQRVAGTTMASPPVRLMRRAQDMDSSRFVLSGKLADVCAALDQLAAQETRNAWRVALH